MTDENSIGTLPRFGGSPSRHPAVRWFWACRYI
jgi:hypothetical protein